MPQSDLHIERPVPVTHPHKRRWRTDRSERIELAIAGIIALGVLLLGLFDFLQGRAPAGLFNLGKGPGLVAFTTACTVCVFLSILVVSWRNNQRLTFARRVHLVAALLPAAFADPTYAVLFLVLPLIGIRRHDRGLVRTTFTGLIALCVGILLLTESSPRVTAEFEAMCTVAIVFFIVTLFGDAMAQLDRDITTGAALAQSLERERLSAEIHDSLGHHLLATSIQLRKAKALRGRSGMTEQQDSAVDLAGDAVAEALAETRLLVEATRNQNGFQIESRVRDLVGRIASPSTEVIVEFSGEHERLDDSTQLTLYRVVQEALSNVVRHSHASMAHVTSTVSVDDVALRVMNNGAAFDIAAVARPSGIENMRRRVEQSGGVFSMSSNVDRTCIDVVMPI